MSIWRKGLASFFILMVVVLSSFAQQQESKTAITFSTANSQFVPVFEVVGQSTGLGGVSAGRISGFITLDQISLRPAFMAPKTVELADGWYRFQIGESPLFSKKFDVVADGTPQTWLLNPGNPGLNISGWVGYAAFLCVTIFGGFDWYATSIGDEGMFFGPIAAPIAAIAGGALTVGSVVLIFVTMPSAHRVE